VIDFEPTEEQQLIVETVRQFAANEIRPRARECDESGKLPQEVLGQAHELGLVANALPEAVGGGGERSAITSVLVTEELAWGDLAIALGVLSPSLTALPICDLGDDAQAERWLRGFTGEHFVPGSLAIVEPAFGASVFEPATTARPDGGGFVLDGEKCLVPWLDGGREVVVTAATPAGPRAFVLSREAEGLVATPERNMGLHALPTVELALSGVRVGAEGALPGDGLRRIVHRGRVALAAAAVGVARASFETARDYAKEREAFGAPIATKQAIAFKLADMAIEIDATRLLAWEAAWRLDQGLDAEREASLALQQAQRVALEVADGAVQVLGGHGYTREYLPEQHLRNARGFACFEALALV
jgi:alkylation response protein AidB-like acyl-CoA dehydrogenase